MASSTIAFRRLNTEQNRVIAFTQLLFFFVGLLLFLFGVVRIALEFGEVITGVNNEALKEGVADWFTGDTYTTLPVLIFGILIAIAGYGLLWAMAALGAKEPPAWAAGYMGLAVTLLTLIGLGVAFVWLEIRWLPFLLLGLFAIGIGNVVLLVYFNRADFRLALGAERIRRNNTPTYVRVIWGGAVVAASVLTVLGLVYGVLTDIIELDLSDVPEGDLIYLSTFDGFNDEWDIENATDSYTSAVIEPDDEGDLRLVLTMTPDAEEGPFTLLDRKVRNFDLRVTTTQLASDPYHDNAFGIIFGYRDEDTYYQFQISGDGYYQLLRLHPDSNNGEIEKISTWHETTAEDEDFEFNTPNKTLIRPGAYNPIENLHDTQNEVRVVVDEQKMYFFVNGQLLPLCLKGTRGHSDWEGDSCAEGNEYTFVFEDESYRQGQIGFLVDRTGGSDPSYPVSIAFDNIVIVGPPNEMKLPSVGETSES